MLGAAVYAPFYEAAMPVGKQMGSDLTLKQLSKSA